MCFSIQCRNLDDEAPIYMHDWTTTSTGLFVYNNFMRGYVGNHSAGGADGAPVHCLYFDAATGNVTATKNVCGSPGTAAVNSVPPMLVAMFCGKNNIINDNIFDLSQNSYVLLYVYGVCNPPPSVSAMTGNTFENNIIISNYAGALTEIFLATGVNYQYGGTPPGYPTIANNMYYNYGGGAVGTTSCCGGPGDASPITGTDPSFNTGNSLYQLNPGSPALGSPMNFPSIPGAYGPQGYVIPAPSSAPVSY